jgi:hypothetical protein
LLLLFNFTELDIPEWWKREWVQPIFITIFSKSACQLFATNSIQTTSLPNEARCRWLRILARRMISVFGQAAAERSGRNLMIIVIAANRHRLKLAA